MPKPKVSTTFNAVNKMKGPLAKMTQSVKRFSKVALVGAGVALGAIAVGVNKFAEAGDEVAKTARKLGLSVEALQELRFAADRSGVSGEAFSDAMKKMNKNIGDLRVGTGMLTTFLNKSNPALAEQLKNVESNEEAFALLTEEMSKIENPMDRAALAQAAFGRAGQDLIIMTENGAAGIAELREEARKYGNIISTEAAASSEKFIDSLTNMKNAGLSLRNKALGPLVEKLQPLIQRMADFIAENDKLINQGIDKTFKAIGQTVRTLVKLWDSGLLPGLLAGVVAYTAIMKAIATYKAVLIFAQAAQIAFNLAMTANPVGLVVAAIAILIAQIVLLIRYWDEVTAVIKRALDSKFITVALLAFAPFLALPILIIKAWQPIMNFFMGLGKVIGAVGNFLGGSTGLDVGAGQAQAGAALRGRNDASFQGGGVTNRSLVGINIAGLPQGSTVNQQGKAPGVTLNYGYRAGGI